VPEDLRRSIIDLFNDEGNAHGEIIQVILTGPVAKEGISLFRVQKAFIINISWNFSMMK
jgi:hypothetical protein